MLAGEAVTTLRRLDLTTRWANYDHMISPSVFPKVDLEKLSGLTSLAVRSSCIRQRAESLQHAAVSSLSCLVDLYELTLIGLFRDPDAIGLVEPFSCLRSLQYLTLEEFRFPAIVCELVAKGLGSLIRLAELNIYAVHGTNIGVSIPGFAAPSWKVCLAAI